MAETLLTLKGVADLLVAGILTLQPSLIYDSFPARTVAAWTGLHMSSAATAPGFNQAIACMVAAVGVGHIVAARSGPAARPSVFAMNATWAILGLASSATPRAWGLSSATLLMTSINHTLFTLALYFSDPAFSGGKPKQA